MAIDIQRVEVLLPNDRRSITTKTNVNRTNKPSTNAGHLQPIPAAQPVLASPPSPAVPRFRAVPRSFPFAFACGGSSAPELKPGF